MLKRYIGDAARDVFEKLVMPQLRQGIPFAVDVHITGTIRLPLFGSFNDGEQTDTGEEIAQ